MTMYKQGLNGNGELLRNFYVEHDHPGYSDDTPSMTRQDFADECDINILMAQYERNAVLPPSNSRDAQYFDASEVPDFRESLDIAREAQEAFMRVPAVVRKELDNDVYKFVEYAADPANIEQLRKWGLAPAAPVEPGPLRVQVVDPLPPADQAKP